MPGSRSKPVSRFLERIEQAPTGCWLWTGSTGGSPLIYGRMKVDGRNRQVHRVSFEYFIGPIPAGLQLDHLCRTPLCVNPTHLEPVTQAANIQRGEAPPAINGRKTHCAKGHPYDEANTHHNGRQRVCRICRREVVRLDNLKRRHPELIAV